MARAAHRQAIELNGKSVLVSWTSRAERALAQRQHPIIMEMELYFSCLIKKFTHFREQSRGRPPVMVTDKLGLYLRPVMSTACTMEEAARLGRQPETEIDTPVAHSLAPKTVFIDYRDGRWHGEYEF